MTNRRGTHDITLMNIVSILRRGPAEGVTTRHARDGTPTPRSTLTAASSPDTAPAARPQTRQCDSLEIQWHMPEKPHKYHLRRRPGRHRDATSRSPSAVLGAIGMQPAAARRVCASSMAAGRIASLIGG